MKKYDAIICDIDGVLLDTTKMNMIPLQKIIKEELDIDMPYQEVLQFVSYPGIKVMETLPFENKEEVYARWVRYVNEFPGGASVYDGIELMLSSIHKYIRQSIVSSKTRKQYELDFVSKGFDQFIDVAVLLDDTTKHKPDPTPILTCIEKMNLSVKKHHIIYIGDALSDYQAAKNAGIDFGYASWGSYSNEGIDNPTFIFNSPSALLEIVKQ